MKKRYNKVMAYMLCNFLTGAVMCPYGIIYSIISGNSSSDYIPFFIICTVLSVFIVFLITRHIIKRTPEGERLGAWFRCLWLGVKVCIKVGLCLTIILIPMMKAMSLSVSEQDEYKPDDWYSERGRVRDDNGNEYKVLRSGEWVEDNSGKRYRVVKNNSGDPYLVSGNDRIELH